MTTLALTPEEFSDLAKRWLAVGTALIVPLTAFVGGVAGFLAFLQAKVNAARLDRHGARIDRLQLNAPPPVDPAVAAFDRGEPVPGEIISKPQ